MRKKIYEHFKSIERKALKGIVDFLDAECGGLDNFDLLGADTNNDMEGLLSFLKEEYGIEVPLDETTLVQKTERSKAIADKKEEERLLKNANEKLMAQYRDIAEITDSPQFKLAKRFIEMAGKSQVGIILEGKQGTGKSTLLRAILNSMKKDYGVLTTATTYLDLLRFLWDNKQKDIVVLEDVAGLWDADKINSLMRQLLGNVNEEKIIYKGTPDYRVRDIDSTFTFKPNVIIVCNEVKNREDPIVRAVLDRCAPPIKIWLSNRELMLMSRIIIQKSKSLSESQKAEVTKFMEAHSTDATDMSLRTVHKIIKYCEKDRKHWKTLALHELQVNPVKKLILEIKDEGLPTVKEEEKKFMDEAERLGLPHSRATFYNYCKELKPIMAEG